ncbi:MAG: hypothetical protein OMM_14224 [Candidatus Magnetoglobus multicellularis str. Araruama]|uniref:Uncharacterized protein n=1 Tax=Candidatus Magnetoglobus multicellularis str. Araruama TaxID=890399 RepID=A0A1V1NS75_9BACT|nr:MAG: hypothetical protein OMM_14224 [Candidatus Magnetoglobus multicellularis str. Araruama]
MRDKQFFKPVNIRHLTNNKLFDEESLAHELNKLVQLNYLAFDPTKTIWQLQGNSMFYGLQQFIKNIEIKDSC